MNLALGNSAECGEAGKGAQKNDEMCSRLGAGHALPLLVGGLWWLGTQGRRTLLQIEQEACKWALSNNEALSQMYCLLGVMLLRQNTGGHSAEMASYNPSGVHAM